MHYFNQPIAINGLVCKNRLVMPPMATAKSTPTGQVSEALCDYYQARAESGCIGLIITEHSYICPQGKAHADQLSISGDGDVDGLRRLVQVIHRAETKVMAQINHAGSAAMPDKVDCDPVAPSPIPPLRAEKASGRKIHELSKPEIKLIVRKFADAAARAKAAGYDGVELHSAHGYLLNQFYSPLTNRRSDEYGPACIEDRVRMHLEVIAAVRHAVGKDYPLALRFGGCDYAQGGSSLEDGVAASLLFQQAGLDLLDISGGMLGYTTSALKGAGYFRDLTAAIKRRVSIPVVLTGGIRTAQEAEKLLSEGCADLIGVGRAQLQDAQWAAKAFASSSCCPRAHSSAPRQC